MAQRYIRDVRFYEDAEGRSEVGEELIRIRRSDVRGFRAIENKIELLRQQTFGDASRSKLIKRPSKHIYVLRVQSGPVSYRLPFFEPPCGGGAVIVMTDCEHRRDLRGDDYDALVEKAERLREDWISRNC